jgi:surfeit locus 1 family protein
MRLTWWAVARRPKWLLALGGFLVIVGVFSALAQWQWQRSIDEATVIERDTENAVSLESVAIPQSTITTDASGRMVSVECQIVATDDLWVTNRAVPGNRGDWLVRHCRTPSGHSVAVVVGWAPTQFDGPYPDTSGITFGRYVPTESPQTSDFEAGLREVIAIGELVNLWAEPGPVYGGFIVMETAPEPLRTIPTEPPPTDASLNILNVFYSIQWLIFAVFALYFWYRLVKDELEKERDASAQDAATDAK